MNIYIWDDLNRMSDNYHDNGGLVVIAESVDAARELLRVEGQYGPPVPWDSDVFTKPPARNYTIGATGHAAEPEIFAFPNAGCC